jgi:hypothetical protein
METLISSFRFVFVRSLDHGATFGRILIGKLLRRFFLRRRVIKAIIFDLI